MTVVREVPVKHFARSITTKGDHDWKIGLDAVESWSGRLRETDSEFEGDGILFRSGDILFGKLRPYLAKAWLADRDGAAVGDFLVLRTSAEMLPRFLQYNLLRPEVIQRLVLTSYGSKMPRTSWEELREICLPFPEPTRQQAALDYLDRETGEIDAFTRDQEELIGLLQERRAATVSHAVTRGLSPSGDERDSGVPWLGAVPASWQVLSGRRLFTQRKDGAKAGDAQLAATQEYGVIEQSRYTELTGNRVPVVLKGFEILKHVEPGDFVISMRSFQGGLEYSHVAGKISSAYVMLFPTQQIETSYFRYLFKSDAFISALRATSSLVRDGQALRFSNFAQVLIPIPPLDEQRRIAKHLDEELSTIDAIVEDARMAIRLSKERRGALIAAVMAGIFDVREQGECDK